MMALEVTVPEDYFGAIVADLNARLATIESVTPRGRNQVVDSLVPLRRMFDYSDKVRSLSQGRASWTMEPSSYAAVPADVVEQMMNPDAGF
jgi:elongation factor G